MFNPEIGAKVSLLFAQSLNPCEQSLLPKAYVFTYVISKYLFGTKTAFTQINGEI